MDKTIKCPNCGQIFDNVDNEFLECANCGKSTKIRFLTIWQVRKNKNRMILHP